MGNIITDKVSKAILEEITSVISTRRNFDSTIKGFRTINLSPSDIAYLKEQFYYNFGKMSNGKMVRLQEKDIHFKFTVNFSVLEKREESFIKNSFERFELEKTSVIVYTNGLKIPDKEIFFYSTDTSTDIMIPEKYIDEENDNVLFVEKREYLRKEYINYHSRLFSGTNLTFTINNEQYTNVDINNHTTMIFVDKKLFTGIRSVSSTPNSLTIIFASPLTDNEIEVFVDSSIKYYDSTFYENTRYITYEVPESYIDPIHGPLSKNSCLFFIDGLRVPSHNITQSGRLHFNKTYTNPVSVTASIFVTDREYIEDVKKINYGSDYYLYNMIGSASITRALRNFLSDSIFDGNIDFNEVLNNNGTKYNRSYVDGIVNTFHSMTKADSQAAYLLTGRPYLMRSFLEQYDKNVYSYKVYYDGIQTNVTLGLPINITPNIQNQYIININNDHVPNNDFITIRKGVTDTFKVPGSFFKPGENLVNITLLSGKQPLVYQRVPVGDIIVGSNINYTGDSRFKDIYYVESDIIVLEKVENDNSYIYMNVEKVGYIIKNDISVIIQPDNTPKVIFHTMPLNDIIIYCKRFVYTYSYQKEITNTEEDVFVPLYIGGTSNPVPFISDNKLEVYAGKVKLVAGIDYFLKNQLNEETLTYSLLVIKRILDPYIEINIYYTNVENRTLIRREGYLENNDYGLFYLDTPFPVSLRYMNIYLNGKMLDYNDIDILSDKLIRVHSLLTPMYDLSVESAFSVNYEQLQPFFYLYEPDTFELFIKETFRSVDYSRDLALGDTPPDVNQVYESFVDEVDSVGKVKNDIAREEDWFYYNEPTTLGVTNDGVAMGGNTIYNSKILGNTLFVMGEGGRIANCDILTNTWYNYDQTDTSHITNDGSATGGGTIYTSEIFGNKLVVLGEGAKIAYVNLLTGLWTNFDAVSGGSLHNSTSHIFLGNIYCSIIYNDTLLIIAGESGRVASYNIKTDTWGPYSEEHAGFVSNVGNALGGSAIRSLDIDRSTGSDILIVSGDNGRVASCFIDNNAWTLYTGVYQNININGPDVYSDGVNRSNKHIYASLLFGSNLIFFGESGFISTFNVQSKIWSGSSSTNSYNLTSSGQYVNNNTIYDITNYVTSYIITGGQFGVISSYNGSVIQWDFYNGQLGIVNIGDAMGGFDIHSMATYDGIVTYIIACGVGGRVASYNIDVHEVPFRFDPYKTSFLLWYITPGNAEVKIPYNIPEEILQQFKIYKDLEISQIYDIIVKSSDMDLMQSITMNEGDAYPYQYPRRTQFIAEFIQALEGLRLTPQMVYDIYKNSPSKNKLYLEDLRPLVSGDEIDGVDDIILHTL